MIVIRSERPADLEAIREIHEQAFGQADEARLVDALRVGGALVCSLVALRDDAPVGHIAFSPLRDEAGKALEGGAALGPMAVLPEHQRRGIGSALVRQGLARMRREGWRFVVLVGHPEFYPRFGFVPAERFGMSCEFELPPEVFMALELEERALADWKGGVRYGPEFHAV